MSRWVDLIQQAAARALEAGCPSAPSVQAPAPAAPPRQLSSASNPAPRRLLLLAADGTIERVLAEPPADKLHAELRRLVPLHPGRQITGEWRKGDSWVRFLITTGLPRDPACFSKETT